mmetsp:Transcript_26226/g.36316  ORF Transcript_26226/g.36316 Transcript_26226/m.36316 type:complete len:394 (+) Transcript_26226:29-1210(+)
MESPLDPSDEEDSWILVGETHKRYVDAKVTSSEIISNEREIDQRCSLGLPGVHHLWRQLYKSFSWIMSPNETRTAKTTTTTTRTSQGGVRYMTIFSNEIVRLPLKYMTIFSNEVVRLPLKLQRKPNYRRGYSSFSQAKLEIAKDNAGIATLCEKDEKAKMKKMPKNCAGDIKAVVNDATVTSQVAKRFTKVLMKKDFIRAVKAYRIAGHARGLISMLWNEVLLVGSLKLAGIGIRLLRRFLEYSLAKLSIKGIGKLGLNVLGVLKSKLFLWGLIVTLGVFLLPEEQTTSITNLLQSIFLEAMKAGVVLNVGQFWMVIPAMLFLDNAHSGYIESRNKGHGFKDSLCEGLNTGSKSVVRAIKDLRNAIYFALGFGQHLHTEEDGSTCTYIEMSRI